MKIMIATPAYGGNVTTTYCDALLWLIDHFREQHPHIRFEHICCSSTPTWDLRPR
jgi:hypothetical protein